MKEADINALVEKTMGSPVKFILDSIMFLSGNDSTKIRTTAFSTLSSLSKFSSQDESVMSQIKRDIEIPNHLSSKEYL